MKAPEEEVRLRFRYPRGYTYYPPQTGTLWVTVDIEAPEAWDNTPQGIIGWSFDVHVDPGVLEPVGAYAATSGYYLYDFCDYYGYTEHYPLGILVGSIDKTTGSITDIAEFIMGYSSLGVGAGGNSGANWYGEQHGLVTLRYNILEGGGPSTIEITNAEYFTATSGPEGIPFDKVYLGYYIWYDFPDLTIEGTVLPYFGPVPLIYPTPEPQLYYDINVTVASGSADAGFFNVSLTVHLDGEIMPEYGCERTVEGIRQDTSETVTFPFNPQDYGNYTLTITADCNDALPEYDETNNVKVTWVLGTIRGDCDGDGDGDRYDFGMIADFYGRRFTSPPYPTADIDWDGDVDRYDFGTFATNYGKTTL